MRCPSKPVTGGTENVEDLAENRYGLPVFAEVAERLREVAL